MAGALSPEGNTSDPQPRPRPAADQATFTENDWQNILLAIHNQRCTPFLGAGASAGLLPVSSSLAGELALQHNFPFRTIDLAGVAQFLALEFTPDLPKSHIRDMFEEAMKHAGAGGTIHSVLAQLPIPNYITTNYDDFMFRALEANHKTPHREVCRWNALLRRLPANIPQPTVASPLVFHMHGFYSDLDSMVLTEDDYLDFLVAMLKDPQVIPPQIQYAFAGTSLMFLGYRMADWNLRVLFRSIAEYLERSVTRSHVSVQLPPNLPKKKREKALVYLNKYFRRDQIAVYWGTCESFAHELQTRWQAYQPPQGARRRYGN